MYYFIALPIAALLYHSICLLLKKYMDREPFWLKIYALAGLGYIIAAPSLFINFLTRELGFSNETSAYSMGITAILVLLLAIKFAPSKQREKTEEWS
ncbi:hypothetical protein [Cytobacillus oceanisediminis]|uniref:hypothetical protein n=1 Tax=Cytobacillus oceanisediminis TaxID=665099 RepID=UPI00204206BD|nr:hypothetical protein [Cytobacillus oceanisediminis]MCM3405930.1 hypothetical protein [Cytobacillus oceanisediminis]